MSVSYGIGTLNEAQRRQQLRRAVLASTVGTAIEWYDFFLYSTVTGLVFAQLYFRQCCNFQSRQEYVSVAPIFWFLGGQPEQPFYKADLRPNIIAPHPSNLPLSDHVHRLITLNCSLGCVEFPEALLGVDPAFYCTMVLLDNVVQVWDGSMAASAAKHPFFVNSRDGRGVSWCQIRIDDAGCGCERALRALRNSCLA